MNPRERKYEATLHEFADAIDAEPVSLKVRSLGHDSAGNLVPAYLPLRCWSPPAPVVEPGEAAWLKVDGTRSVKWISHATGVEVLVAAENVAAGCDAALSAVTNLRRELAKPEYARERALTSDLAIDLRWRADSEVEHRELAHFGLAEDPPRPDEIAAAARQYVE